mmetsp:Transcript_5711/g.8774  ORF Transcript_5711/g.8774 Transcript_5711/m.8774 type:complete len:80 (-) Transcript_5711:114-353(-)
MMDVSGTNRMMIQGVRFMANMDKTMGIPPPQRHVVIVVVVLIPFCLLLLPRIHHSRLFQLPIPKCEEVSSFIADVCECN